VETQDSATLRRVGISDIDGSRRLSPERHHFSSQSHREGTISVATPDLLPTNPEQGSRDSIRHWHSEDNGKTKDKTEVPIIPPRFHPELFSTVSAFIPSNNADRTEVIGCKPLTQARNMFKTVIDFSLTIFCDQDWSGAMLEKCKEKRLDIILRDVNKDCEECKLKCFNEKEIKAVLAEARASQATFNAQMRSEGPSFSERKVR
jgi:hypothetical protein